MNGSSGIQILGVLAAFAGILVMVFQASLGALLELNVNGGDLIMFGAVCFWSLYAVSLHRGADLPSVEVLLFLIASLGAVAGIPFYLAESLLVGPFQVSLASVSAAAFLSVGATGLAVYFWTTAIRTVGANRAAVFLNLIPVFGAGPRHRISRRTPVRLPPRRRRALVITGIFLAVRTGSPRREPAP